MNQRPSLFILILIGLVGVLVIAVVIALAVAAYLPVRSVTSSPEVGQPIEVVETLAVENPPTAESAASTAGVAIAPPGFEVFTDEALGFSLARPVHWQEEERSFEYSRVFNDLSAEQPPTGPLPVLFVTCIPVDDRLAEGSYAYMSNEDVRRFQALAVGASQPIVPDAFPPEAFTYTRLPDRPVAGAPALVIENEGVWEAPEESTERRAIVVTENGNCIIGSLYITPEQLALYEQVLDSFVILPEQE
jgi:hypothetical protein